MHLADRRKLTLAGPLSSLLALLLVWFLSGNRAFAQIQVSLQFPRSTYLLNEPTLAKLTLTNLAGRDLYLEDSPASGPWCRLEVKNLRGGYLSPKRDHISFPPVSLPTGQSVSRSVPLTDFFHLPEPGQYQLRVSVFFEPTKNTFFAQSSFSADSGRLEWTQTVGVPEGRQNAGAYRTFSVMSHQRLDGIFLYALLEGKSEGIRFAPVPLGRMLSAMRPQAQVDASNNLNVFHAISDSEYVLSQINVDTGRSGQARYRSLTPRSGRPTLARNEEGRLAILGGVRITEEELESEKSGRVLLSDRPNVVPAPSRSR
jgi:hypothetical protein